MFNRRNCQPVQSRSLSLKTAELPLIMKHPEGANKNKQQIQNTKENQPSLENAYPNTQYNTKGNKRTLAKRVSPQKYDTQGQWEVIEDDISKISTCYVVQGNRLRKKSFLPGDDRQVQRENNVSKKQLIKLEYLQKQGLLNSQEQQHLRRLKNIQKPKYAQTSYQQDRNYQELSQAAGKRRYDGHTCTAYDFRHNGHHDCHRQKNSRCNDFYRQEDIKNWKQHHNLSYQGQYREQRLDPYSSRQRDCQEHLSPEWVQQQCGGMTKYQWRQDSRRKSFYGS